MRAAPAEKKGAAAEPKGGRAAEGAAAAAAASFEDLFDAALRMDVQANVDEFLPSDPDLTLQRVCLFLPDATSHIMLTSSWRQPQQAGSQTCLLPSISPA